MKSDVKQCKTLYANSNALSRVARFGINMRRMKYCHIYYSLLIAGTVLQYLSIQTLDTKTVDMCYQGIPCHFEN